MLNILDDGPFRYIHCGATGELIMTLVETGSGFVEDDVEGEPRPHPLRHWKAVARRRIGNRLQTLMRLCDISRPLIIDADGTITDPLGDGYEPAHRLAWRDIPINRLSREQMISCIEALSRDVQACRAERDDYLSRWKAAEQALDAAIKEFNRMMAGGHD